MKLCIALKTWPPTSIPVFRRNFRIGVMYWNNSGHHGFRFFSFTALRSVTLNAASNAASYFWNKQTIKKSMLHFWNSAGLFREARLAIGSMAIQNDSLKLSTVLHLCTASVRWCLHRVYVQLTQHGRKCLFHGLFVWISATGRDFLKCVISLNV